tara:strand:- start:235 stop:432 length:198 start_codon:yes stop_codon:yes gene_type:complete
MIQMELLEDPTIVSIPKREVRHAAESRKEKENQMGTAEDGNEDEKESKNEIQRRRERGNKGIIGE